ncbi:MAG: hypothetical protein N2689_02165 [Verrucomicrobiae bacterium]|nr:hypothetical protein [Verrucomicrobiae bacterium]
MTLPTSNPPSSSGVVVSFCVAILGLLLFVQGWLVSSYVGQQNTQISGAIAGGNQQLNFMRQFDQNNQAFLGDVLNYYQQTRDSNVIMILNRAGINLQQQPPAANGGAAPTAPAATPAAGS